MHGFKRVNGFMFPESDIDCNAVVFNSLPDLDKALGYVRKYDVAIQAGGNVGVWPAHLAKRFGMVYTFEPEPSNFTCLVNNCAEENLLKFHAALGYARASVSMECPEGIRNMGACCINGEGTIQMVRIDDLMLTQCDFIQLDIEGYEPDALRGALEIVRRFHPVVMLEDKGLSEKYGHPQGWSRKAMEAEGYRLMDHVNRDMIYAFPGRNDAKRD